MAFDNKKPLGEQIDWADIAQKITGAFNHCSDVLQESRASNYEGEMQAGIAIGQLAQALETIVKRQETELRRGTRVLGK